MRLVDDIAQHPKAIAAGPVGAWLWVACIGYARRFGTGGVVPREVLRSWGQFRRPLTLAAQLAEVGLLEVVEGGFCVVDDDLVLPDLDQVPADGSTRPSSARRVRLHRAERGIGKRALIQMLARVRARDRGGCRYCGVAVNWKDRRGPTGATYDHVDPAGPETDENLVVSCRGCNSRKGPRSLDEARMTLRDLGPDPGPGPRSHARDLGPDLGPDLDRDLGSRDRPLTDRTALSQEKPWYQREKPEGGLGETLTPAAVWAMWRRILTDEIGSSPVQKPSTNETESCRVLAESGYTPAQLTAAMRLLCTSAHFTGKRSLGMLRANVAQLDAWARDHPGAPFGERPRPGVTTPRLVAADTCPHTPPCTHVGACKLRQVREGLLVIDPPRAAVGGHP